MNQQEFVARYEPLWRELESVLESLDRGGQVSTEFPFIYRQTCQHLALARDRGYAPYLIERLNQLVLRAHQHLYEARAGVWSRIVHFAAAGFPALVRSEARLLWIAAAVFLVPGLAMMAALQIFPDLVFSVLDPAQVSRIEEMYRPGAPHLGRERPSDSDFLMFGFYIRNNIGIAFQTFASGLLFGVGSLLYLAFNGLFIGTVAGHLVNAGFAETFFPFVIGHGAFELTAIVLAGAAGMRMGLALLSPGRLTRTQALKGAARLAVGIVYGAAVMLVMAAFLEAFWSSSATVPAEVKYAVGGVFWLTVIAYFSVMGRRRGP